MNFCTKCQSIYQQPGTCNCYAASRPLVPVQPLPLTPQPLPYIGDPPPPMVGGTTITVKACEGGKGGTLMYQDGSRVPFSLTVKPGFTHHVNVAPH